MIVTIEGHDGVGKTTLAETLSKELGFEYTKHSLAKVFDLSENDFRKALTNLIAYDNTFFTAWFLALNDMFALENSRNKNVVVDRHILLNYFWNWNLETKAIFDLSIKYSGKPDLVVLLTATKKTRIERIKERNLADEDLKNKTACNAEDDILISFLKKQNYKYIVINTDNLSKQDVLKIAKEKVLSLMKEEND